MTDNEIIKALECCIKAETRNNCEQLKCPACDDIGCRFSDNSDNDFINVSRNLCQRIFSLINRRKAESERLKKLLQFAEECIAEVEDAAHRGGPNDYIDSAIEKYNNLVKEMTEDEGK